MYEKPRTTMVLGSNDRGFFDSLGGTKGALMREGAPSFYGIHLIARGYHMWVCERERLERDG
jgi:hypothetical protein